MAELQQSRSFQTSSCVCVSVGGACTEQHIPQPKAQLALPSLKSSTGSWKRSLTECCVQCSEVH